MVVKQSLPRLRVEADWHAPRDRILTECEALDLCGRLTPGHAPRVLDIDEAQYILCIERAPASWTDWKTALMRGDLDPAVARELGRILATWHAGTMSADEITDRMADPVAFEVLRVDPYFRTLAAAVPAVARKVEEVVRRLESRRLCLVHGDFSPKNVLVGPAAADVMVIDFEVAHLGDPEFDVAFLLSHLCLKAVHRPELASRFDELCETFLRAYAEAVPDELRVDGEWVGRYVGALLLARVYGKSPVEYLDAGGRERTAAVGWDLVDGRGTGTIPLSALQRGTTA